MWGGTINIANLSLEERLRLLEQIWESLSATPEAIPLANAQREELDRRLDELDGDGPTGIPWEEVLRRIRIISAREATSAGRRQYELKSQS